MSNLVKYCRHNDKLAFPGVKKSWQAIDVYLTNPCILLVCMYELSRAVAGVNNQLLPWVKKNELRSSQYRRVCRKVL